MPIYAARKPGLIALITEFFGCTIAVAVAATFAWLSQGFLPRGTLVLFFLPPVLFAAARYRMLPSLYAVVLSLAAYNFFFTAPVFTLSVYSRADIATLLFFPVIALLTGNIAMQLKNKVDRLQAAAQRDAAIEAARILADREKLRSALLSSISHDLRTPLVSIIGSAATLQDIGGALSPALLDDLVGNILGEAERLNRFIQNLLDMTRLGHGDMKPNREWVEFRDVLGHALMRTEKETRAHRIELGPQPETGLLFVDAVLMEQVFVNILDNAAKYAPPGSRIEIDFRRDAAGTTITFDDEGIGIPSDDREAVFDMFYRVRAADSRIAGTGLGLAICRGLVEAQGGTIEARAAKNGFGTSIVINFPMTEIEKKS